MHLAQLLRERRSVHRFEPREVPIDLVMELMDTAVWVPNYHMTQPWRFIISYGEGKHRMAEVVRQLKESNEPDVSKKKDVGQKFYDKIMAIPMIITVIMKEDPNIIVREEDFASTSCIIHNFSLLAWEQGIGINWETYPWLLKETFRTAMGIQPGEKVIGNLHVGYPAMVPKAQPRVPAAERITIVSEA
ncbi:nitroreductase [Paenibacillus cellulosilyticus]|uniref:Putative NAD(P)H nitroreductase n=1 Tax=Paenibacillus cellulosilyticus TaxID=375489 RepID=A0A2V2YR32_9BACL|nr:nitroreductase [Paenibacillus cellulosilyticus]PWV97348.1 nitroreductase [Paenibacillus cellulosilyticus]QKS47455.1 nitroreductase [Paenibacillus cellulosilyticus]